MWPTYRATAASFPDDRSHYVECLCGKENIVLPKTIADEHAPTGTLNVVFQEYAYMTDFVEYILSIKWNEFRAPKLNGTPIIDGIPPVVFEASTPRVFQVLRTVCGLGPHPIEFFLGEALLKRVIQVNASRDCAKWVLGPQSQHTSGALPAIEHDLSADSERQFWSQGVLYALHYDSNYDDKEMRKKSYVTETEASYDEIISPRWPRAVFREQRVETRRDLPQHDVVVEGDFSSDQAGMMAAIGDESVIRPGMRILQKLLPPRWSYDAPWSIFEHVPVERIEPGMYQLAARYVANDEGRRSFRPQFLSEAPLERVTYDELDRTSTVASTVVLVASKDKEVVHNSTDKTQDVVYPEHGIVVTGPKTTVDRVQLCSDVTPIVY